MVYEGCGDAGGCNGSTDCLTPTIWGWSRGLEADWSYRLNFLHDVTGGNFIVP